MENQIKKINQLGKILKEIDRLKALAEELKSEFRELGPGSYGSSKFLITVNRPRQILDKRTFARLYPAEKFEKLYKLEPNNSVIKLEFGEDTNIWKFSEPSVSFKALD